VKRRLYERNFGAKADWIRSLPCHTCDRHPPSDPAHLKSRGAGGDLSHLIPLCRTCHMSQHSIGIKTFFKRHGIDDYMQLCDTYERRWREEGGRDLDF